MGIGNFVLLLQKNNYRLVDETVLFFFPVETRFSPGDFLTLCKESSECVLRSSDDIDLVDAEEVIPVSCSRVLCYHLRVA